MNEVHLAYFGGLTREADKRSSQNGGSECARLTLAVNIHTGEDRRDTEYIAVNL